MSSNFQANLLKTLSALTSACDLSTLRLVDHSQRVAYLSLRIGEALDLGEKDLRTLLICALIHDIGVSTSQEKIALTNLELDPELVSGHCRRGYGLIKDTSLFRDLAPVILHHHDKYNDEQPLASAIIYVADAVDIRLDRAKYSLWQSEEITEFIASEKGSTFYPPAVDAFRELSKNPSVWLDLESGNYQIYLKAHGKQLNRRLSLTEFTEIANLFATIIDDKSSYTAYHSQGVSNVAWQLATQAGLQDQELQTIKLAGLLHDLGKLAIPDEILESPNALTKLERQLMVKHPYYTYHLLGQIGQDLQSIQEPAAFHHEKLDATGYPFRLGAKQLSLPARILAVADITQALSENRPYRPPLAQRKVAAILQTEAKNNHLDAELVDLATENLDQLTLQSNA